MPGVPAVVNAPSDLAAIAIDANQCQLGVDRQLK